MRPLFLPLIAIAALLTVAGGCASTPSSSSDYRDPLLRMNNAQLSSGDRTSAVRAAWTQYENGELDREIFTKSMKSMAWKYSAPGNVRNAAIDNLTKLDPDDTANMVRLMLQSETDWSVIEHICEIVAANDWKRATPGLVRSWARPVFEPPDDLRPERKALVALYPDRSVEEVIFEVFTTPVANDPLFGEKTRRDAWALLLRIDQDGRNAEALLTADEQHEDPLIRTLQEAAGALHAIPLNAEQLSWLQQMRAPESGSFWDEAAHAIAQLDEWKQNELQMRHVAVIRWFHVNEPEYLQRSREELVRLLELRLDNRRHHRRTAGFATISGGIKETISFWDERLVWADLLGILLADIATRDQNVQNSFFIQAHADMLDKSTEHGGVLHAYDRADDTPTFLAQPFEPRPTQRYGDNRFVASAELIDASALAPFHYHFHAQRVSNVEYAGPGPGDLEYAERHGRFCLVLTYVTRTKLNIDIYLPNSARVDLGNINAED